MDRITPTCDRTRRTFDVTHDARLRAALVASACVGVLLTTPTAARAQIADLLDVEAAGHWRVAVTPGMVHFNRSPPEPYKPVWGLALERQRDDRWLYGGSYFSDSFGQDSGYVYVGRQVPDLFDEPQLFFQWSVGVLYGYKGAYENRVPLNYKSFSPGAVLSLGWRFSPQFAAQIDLVGTAGLMLQLSHDYR